MSPHPLPGGAWQRRKCMIGKGMYVSAITQQNQAVSGVFRVSDVARQQKNNGENYWAFNINDASGAMPARRWPQGGVLAPQDLPEGAYVLLQGAGSPYREQMQVRADVVRVLTDEEIAALDPGDFLPPPPYDGPGCTARLLELMERETAGTPWNRLVHAWFGREENRKAFEYASAARSVHHIGRGGLAAHTLEVCRLCAAVADVCGDVDRPALLCGALFHDIGKLSEMETGIYETQYTVPGKLLGHLVIGVTMLLPYCLQAELPNPLRMHLFHLILSHHGTPEHGAVKAPATREAVILAQADMMSARLNTMASTLQSLSEGAMTPRDVFAVGGPVYHPVSTASAMASPATDVASVQASACVTACEESAEHVPVQDSRRPLATDGRGGNPGAPREQNVARKSRPGDCTRAGSLLHYAMRDNTRR